MADLIDRQALLGWFENWSDYDEFSVGYITGVIEDVPSAERHGRWIYTPTSPLGYTCSECGKTMCRFNYCPHCGARNDGEHDG